MKLGFVSAVLADLSLDDVLAFAGRNGYDCVEVMCWPPGKAERRYAGVSHLDVTDFDQAAASRLNELTAKSGVSISSLGYYPNPLSADPGEREVATTHLRKVIDASAALGLGLVTTFVGRNPALTIDANWPQFLQTWRPLLEHAQDRGVKIAIENCPMLFSADEWPGGKNLATSPTVWRRMFNDLPTPNLGLNYDPSHLIWQHMDYLAPIHEFHDKLFHVHAKDARIDRAALDSHGVLAHPKLWHTPKLPGLGDVRWGAFFAALGDVGYEGAVAVEVEDRNFETNITRRKDSLVLSQRYLQQFVV
jgi:sugar phosphate isomerase/epimerase